MPPSSIGTAWPGIARSSVRHSICSASHGRAVNVAATTAGRTQSHRWPALPRTAWARRFSSRRAQRPGRNASQHGSPPVSVARLTGRRLQSRGFASPRPPWFAVVDQRGLARRFHTDADPSTRRHETCRGNGHERRRRSVETHATFGGAAAVALPASSRFRRRRHRAELPHHPLAWSPWDASVRRPCHPRSGRCGFPRWR